ncbi:MAG: cyclodeaminase/cyclohydrolase family protein, partial [Bacteroidetes bacterium]|nr:cyclodeaminase/cyclohydrolase family protein [Bacteroidota bacterium]
PRTKLYERTCVDEVALPNGDPRESQAREQGIRINIIGEDVCPIFLRGSIVVIEVVLISGYLVGVSSHLVTPTMSFTTWRSMTPLAAVSLTNIGVTPMHVAFDEVVAKARERGIRVTGSELVGLIPLRALLDAGKYFLRKQQRSTGISDREIIKIAVKSLGLEDLTPFNPNERIIEYAIADPSRKRLVDMSIEAFAEETASESPAPGGGSVSAAVGAFGVALGSMVANLSAHKRGWDERWEEFSDWAERGKANQDELLRLVDQDTEAFKAVMAASGLPKGSDAEQAERIQAIQAATRGAIEIPLRVMEVALDSMAVMKAMAEVGNPNSVSDAGVGALCARAAVRGAYLNVQINVGDLEDKAFVEDVLSRGQKMVELAEAQENEILAIVDERL